MDISITKSSNLLIIREIFPDDFSRIDGIYVIKKNQIQEKANIYTEMPKRFTSVESWPVFSNLRCWECDRLPTSYPKFIPINPEKDPNGNDTCDVYGHFDEWNCASRYIMHEMPKEQQWDLAEFLCLFESKFSGKRREKIMPSPPKTMMEMYCGSRGVSPLKYKEKIEQINNDFDLGLFKMSHFTKLD